jgi:hypothetical protein
MSPFYQAEDEVSMPHHRPGCHSIEFNSGRGRRIRKHVNIVDIVV